MALCSSSDCVSGGMAVGWASTVGILGLMGDNHCCFITGRKETDRYCIDEKTEKKITNFVCSPIFVNFSSLHLFFLIPLSLKDNPGLFLTIFPLNGAIIVL